MHEGHRQRLYDRLEEGDNLYEHELLEILLYNAYPRCDVNPIAHALLMTFASIREVLNADIRELCAVEGVGKNVALYLKCVGRCLKLCNECDCFAIIKNTDEFKKFILSRFRGKKVEILEIYFLDKTGKLKRISSYTNDETECVHMPSEEISRLISIYQPYGIFAAHNHVMTSSRPSLEDNKFTKRLQLICDLNNVRFYDHCIYASDKDIFSYYLTNRIDKIRDDFTVENIIRKSD